MTATVNHVEIEGLDEMLKNLAKIDEGIRDDVALEAVHEGGSIIMARAQMNAPVLTSNLKNSIRVESYKTGHGAVAEIGPHIIYGRIQELGGYTGRGHKTKIVGKFYLSRAVEEKKGEVSAKMAGIIRDYLGD